MRAASGTICGRASEGPPNLVWELRELAEPRVYGDTIRQMIERAARRAGLSYWRAFDIWYGKARRIEDAERARIAEALDTKRSMAARNELHELRLRIAKLEALFAQTHPDVARPRRAADRDRD